MTAPASIPPGTRAVTAAERRAFQSEFMQQIGRMGLNRVSVLFRNLPNDSSDYATIKWDLNAGTAEVELASVIDSNRNSLAAQMFAPKRLARHEAAHLLLAALVGVAKSRYAEEREIDTAAEDICLVLERLL